MSKISRILIANRGEIAVRIIRSCRELGIETVAVYSDADHMSQHRFQADFAVRLPGIQSTETYLKIPALIAALKASQADAVHPGYGFLSENPAFARAVAESGATFIGPSPEAMEKLGNKIHAKNLMIAAGVPVMPGAREPLKDTAELKKIAHAIGYPLILKAAGGGGGRGMRVVRQDSELEAGLATCVREAKAYFGSSDVFCERYIEHPRHIEFQVIFDHHGNGVHLFERDCSVQRRHQKLFEEAPSCYLTPAQRDAVGAKAIAAAKAAGYVNAGTIEFICESPDHAYFMEMNTRIQVEHPVTEMITGIDLIATQIKVARGEPLPFTQADLTPRGWAMEARINCEDPARDFAPGPGLITDLALPQGPFTRVDTHLYSGYTVPDAYDSMVAKVITWGATRQEAAARLKRALGELRLTGVPTTAPFHEALLAHPDFIAGHFTTRFIEENAAYWQKAYESPPADAPSLAAVAAVAAATDGAAAQAPLPPAPSRWHDAARREGSL